MQPPVHTFIILELRHSTEQTITRANKSQNTLAFIRFPVSNIIYDEFAKLNGVKFMLGLKFVAFKRLIFVIN